MLTRRVSMECRDAPHPRQVAGRPANRGPPCSPDRASMAPEAPTAPTEDLRFQAPTGDLRQSENRGVSFCVLRFSFCLFATTAPIEGLRTRAPGETCGPVHIVLLS